MREDATAALSHRSAAGADLLTHRAGLVTTARALGQFYRDLVAGALLAPELLSEAIQQRVRGSDLVLLESAFGLGYMLRRQLTGECGHRGKTTPEAAGRSRSGTADTLRYDPSVCAGGG